MKLQFMYIVLGQIKNIVTSRDSYLMWTPAIQHLAS